MNTKELDQEFYGFVTSTEIIERNGHMQYVMNLCTAAGPVALKLWDLKSEKVNDKIVYQPKASLYPKTNDFLKVILFNYQEALQELKNYSSIGLDTTNKKPYHASCEIINKEEVPEEILPKIWKDRESQSEYAKKLLSDDSYWNDKNCGKLLREIILNNKKFAVYPAAKGQHHAYKYGLLIHTAEVFSNCRSIANSEYISKFYKTVINTDVLYLSAWLHDIGKIEVYDLEEDSIKHNSDAETLQSHLVRSNNIFQKYVHKADYGFEKDFIDHVSHCILSHHERREWDAAQEPKTIEAIILCRSDYISSEIGKRENGLNILPKYFK